VMKVLIVLVTLAFIGLVRADEDSDAFWKTYGKFAASDGLRSEGAAMLQTRLQLFKKAKKQCDDNNAEDKSGFQMTADNAFSFLSDSEKQSHLGLNASEADMRRRSARSAGYWAQPSTIVKRDVDADYTDKLPPVKNQGSCGSCWAFGAMAALEYQVNRKAGSCKKSLSEQQFLDCTYTTRDGCNGGWPAQCYTVASQAGSIVHSKADRPYTGSDGACTSYTAKANAIAGYTIASAAKYIGSGDSNMLAAVADAEIGVISVAIGVYGKFFQYSSGVFTDTECQSKGINHAVDIVGYGTEGSLAYWRVRNSWGSNWGDAGYLKMQRGAGSANVNLCKISQYGHYPVVTGEDAADCSDDEEEGNDDEGDDEGEDESDDGCNAGTEACGCNGECLHEHMCPTDCDNNDDEDEDEEDATSTASEEPTQSVCTWKKESAVKCMGKMGTNQKMSLAAATEACEADEDCNCVTCKKGKKKCAMKKKNKTKTAKDSFVSYFCEQ